MKHLRILLLLVLALGVVLCGLTSCEQVKDVAGKVPFLDKVVDKLPGGNDHEHVFSEATCTAPKTCECGETEGEPLPHTFVNGKCECGAEDPNYSLHFHSYKSVHTAPTCTEYGYTTYTCACGDSYVSGIQFATGHDFTEVVTEPTCLEGGYTTYTCNTCGHTEVGDETSATGHAFVDGKCRCGLEYTYTAPKGAWTLTTELKDGDHVLIGAPAYGKLLSAEKVSAGSYYNKGVDYSADNFDNVTDAEIFVVTVNADGTYTFTSLTGEVIALAASYSSLNKDGEHKSWTLEAKGEGTFLMKNTGRNYYLEWYSSKNNWSTYSAGNTDEYVLSFYVQEEVEDGEHVHNHISKVTAPTCTEDGYVTYTCSCGDTYTGAGEPATGHSHESKVTAPTCTEDGYVTYTCSCGDTYTEAGEPATGHSYDANGICSCGDVDLSVHSHVYTAVVTAPTCQAAGFTTHTCVCGDTYTDTPVDPIPHVDNNLDITCDYDGCTTRILPEDGSDISLFTANSMIIVSTSRKYYVEGVVTEITDAKNGIFIITDEAGNTILIRLPKDANGTLYSAWTGGYVVKGDTVRVYGTPSKNSSTPTTQKAKIEGGLLTVIKHDHNFSEATCTSASVCACGLEGAAALGHTDELDSNGFCDRCEWDLSLVVSHITVATDPSANGVLDDAVTKWQWSNNDFTVEIAKGSSTVTLYKTAKAYMQLKKQNVLTVYNTNGATMKQITIYTTNATQLTNLKNAIGTQYTYTVNDADLSVTIVLDSTDNFTFTNVSTTTAYVSGVEIVYAPATVTE